jgi:uncharacterized protein (DUF58 family)
MIKQLTEWVETHWITPSYTGWILLGIGLSLFGAATNTMAGWLYAISGMIFAILALNGLIAQRTVKKLKIERLPITPVTAGDQLTIEIIIENPTREPKTLLEIIDQLPFVLSPPITTAIESIPPWERFHWSYYAQTKKRGVYHWYELQLKTAAPLGVFYCRKNRELPTKAIVYPQVLPLKECPLVDSVGREESRKLQSERMYQAATEGITKALRQYRFGDPTRLIHWRSSARFGELKVRELEVITGGEDVIICLDNSPLWHDDYFEEAVIAAASLYFYASRCKLNVKLWTADTGVIQGSRVVLETLAGVEYGKGTTASYLPPLPVIWIAQDTSYFDSLSLGSRWFLFPSASGKIPSVKDTRLPGLIFNPQETLEIQLQKP